MKEDRVNAPHRPSYSGELGKKNAVIITLALFLLGAIVTYFLNPAALILYLSGFAFNVLYEYKIQGIPIAGNFWFGLMIALAPLYGALAVSDQGISSVIANKNLLFITLLVALSSSALCYLHLFQGLCRRQESR